MPTTYDDDFGWKPRYVGKTKPVAQAQPSALDSLLAEQEAVEQKHLPELPAMSGINRDVQPVERPKKIGEQFEAREQQNSGDTEQARPTVGDTPSGVLDGLIRPLSAQEQANRERMYAARQGVAGLGNGLAALANVLYAGKGATPQQIPDIPDADGKQLLSWQDRLMQDRYRQADMDLAQLRENRDEEFRRLQLELARQKAADDKALDERDFNYQVEQDAKKLAIQEQQAALAQQNAVQKMGETVRHNKANEEAAQTRAARTGSNSGSGTSGNAWHPLRGYGGTTVNVNATRINNEIAETSIGGMIPESLKEEWKRAKMGGSKSKAEVIQEAMQNSEEFQKWMIDHKYAQLSDMQDAPQDNGVLDLGDDSDDDNVFDGANF